MHKYDVVVFKLDPYSWGWEVRRNGRPLPIPLRAIDCRSEAGARKAAGAALRRFLMGLKREQEAKLLSAKKKPRLGERGQSYLA
jgi:hypothetical protein